MKHFPIIGELRQDLDKERISGQIPLKIGGIDALLVALFVIWCKIFPMVPRRQYLTDGVHRPPGELDAYIAFRRELPRLLAQPELGRAADEGSPWIAAYDGKRRLGVFRTAEAAHAQFPNIHLSLYPIEPPFHLTTEVITSPPVGVSIGMLINLEAFEQNLPQLLADPRLRGDWALIYDGKLVQTFPRDQQFHALEQWRRYPKGTASLYPIVTPGESPLFVISNASILPQRRPDHPHRAAD